MPLAFGAQHNVGGVGLVQPLCFTSVPHSVDLECVSTRYTLIVLLTVIGQWTLLTY